MTDIQCRPPNEEHNGIKEKIDCSLNKGFVCQGECSNYEIRVLCKCKNEKSMYSLLFIVTVYIYKRVIVK